MFAEVVGGRRQDSDCDGPRMGGGGGGGDDGDGGGARLDRSGGAHTWERAAMQVRVQVLAEARCWRVCLVVYQSMSLGGDAVQFGAMHSLPHLPRR